MRAGALLVIGMALVAVPAPARVNPRLKDVHKISVHPFSESPADHANLASGSAEKVHRASLANIVSSSRFVAVKEDAKADAELEGAAGWVNSEKDGKSYASGYAHLELVDLKSKEVIWVFDYKSTPGAGGYASDRVANQFIEKLLDDAKAADNR